MKRVLSSQSADLVRHFPSQTLKTSKLVISKMFQINFSEINGVYMLCDAIQWDDFKNVYKLQLLLTDLQEN